jgi:hypothetical protein
MGLWLIGDLISLSLLYTCSFPFLYLFMFMFPFSVLSIACFDCDERIALTFRIPPLRSLEFFFSFWDFMSIQG